MKRGSMSQWKTVSAAAAAPHLFPLAPDVSDNVGDFAVAAAAAAAADADLAASDDAAALVGAEVGSAVEAAAAARTWLVESSVALRGCHNSPAPQGH